MRAIYEDMHREIETINGADLANTELNDRSQRTFETRDRIASLPAQTFDDVLVKLQELEYVTQEWDHDTNWHEPLLRTAREGLERLIREGGA
jgi:hypothetical protein